MYILVNFDMEYKRTFETFNDLKKYFSNVKANSYKQLRDEVKRLYGNNIQINKF